MSYIHKLTSHKLPAYNRETNVKTVSFGKAINEARGMEAGKHAPMMIYRLLLCIARVST